ncbi:transport and Golgi organization protein 11 [Coccinella septempunctata]|uniref:transport and Golgi organization protein 11 n=1 Tax=Coccinella septempunctata TaxID=41139 RepID=UPI001D08EA7E|nr:transport and Golgi organization protein 11 [Coccinella septempunctata]
MSANANLLQFEDAFVTDINQQMKVPDKISFNQESNGIPRAEWMKESINMQVPERILVAGHHQHVGTRAPPREIAFDKSIIVTEPYPGDVRVATPPRTLTLDKYPFPEFQDLMQEEEAEPFISKPKNNYPNDTDFIVNSRALTPPIGGGGDNLTTSDEIHHLRKQMVKLNRRVMSLEMENINRLQREKFVLGFGVAYFLFKFIIWMSKD